MILSRDDGPTDHKWAQIATRGHHVCDALAMINGAWLPFTEYGNSQGDKEACTCPYLVELQQPCLHFG